jgi:mannose-6-phosphate isomerase
MAVSVLPLDNPVQNYAWGSKEAIAALLGRPNPSGRPEAELWIGSHPTAPSRVDGATAPTTLAERIRSAPEAMLGAAVAREFGGELPFLLKVIAAAEPLSIQCHPNAEQARAGFEREDRLGIPRDAFERSYRDPHHKPELVVALSRFLGLLGFRGKDEILRLVVPLGVAGLEAPLAALARSADEEGPRASCTPTSRGPRSSSWPTPTTSSAAGSRRSTWTSRSSSSSRASAPDRPSGCGLGP